MGHWVRGIRRSARAGQRGSVAQNVPISTGFSKNQTIAADPDITDILIFKWIFDLRSAAPRVRIRRLA